jgi:hypothetical protein
MTDRFDNNKQVALVTGANVKKMAERELWAFIRAVTELHGSEQARASTEDWLRELMASRDLPASAREWRTVTIAAAAQLAGRVNASL